MAANVFLLLNGLEIDVAEPEAVTRKLLVDLTPEGRAILERAVPRAIEISAMTLAPLSREEQAMFMRLLSKLS